jgi:hypothetical protein
MKRTEYGKIASIEFGYGGYQDAQLGFSIVLEGPGWGVGDFKGTWACDPDQSCKWTKEDQIQILGETTLWLRTLLNDAKVMSLDKLKNKPVVVTFEDNMLKEWRIFKEVL